MAYEIDLFVQAGGIDVKDLASFIFQGIRSQMLGAQVVNESRGKSWVAGFVAAPDDPGAPVLIQVRTDSDLLRETTPGELGSLTRS
ncbi:hypothetical protein ACH4OY_20670 [Micromonospora rubida]|uniref:Uncharacterized protein n=1 Tax=Micromonospora rubida TaxID=2697657 RepID=A0ABW7SPL0_9ACTN